VNGYIKVQITPEGSNNAITVVDLQNINTHYNSTYDYVDSIAFGHPWFGNADFDFDDFYIEDSVSAGGEEPDNDFLGDVRVATSSAVGNDHVQWSPLDPGN